MTLWGKIKNKNDTAGLLSVHILKDVENNYLR